MGAFHRPQPADGHRCRPAEGLAWTTSAPTVLSGGVTIVQGTLDVAADQAVITTAAATRRARC